MSSNSNIGIGGGPSGNTGYGVTLGGKVLNHMASDDPNNNNILNNCNHVIPANNNPNTNIINHSNNDEIETLKGIVEAIINNGSTKYDPANLPFLSKCVNEQINHNINDMNCNLTILHIYSFYPQCFDYDVCRKILIRGILNLPNIDFTQYSYLIHENFTKDKKLSSLLKIHDHIQSCRFTCVWEEIKKDQQYLMSINDTSNLLPPYFIDWLKNYIAEILSLVFYNINTQCLMQMLNISTISELDRFCKQKCWILFLNNSANSSTNSVSGTSIQSSILATPSSPLSLNTTSSNSVPNNLNALPGPVINNSYVQISKPTPDVIPSTNNSKASQTIPRNAVSHQNSTNVAQIQKSIDAHMNLDSLRHCFSVLQKHS